jgi:glycosyltransferase involved in cell wall biosynthesis
LQTNDLVSLAGHHIMDGARGAAALRGLYDQNTRRLLERWIQANDDDHTVYHLHNWHKVLSPSIFAALKPIQNRLFVWAHDYFLGCPNGGYFHYARQRACELRPMSGACVLTQCDRRNYLHKLWRVSRTAIRRSLFDFAEHDATVIAVHEGMIPYLERGGIPQHRIRVLRNPVTPWCSSRVPAERNREILFVGRLERDKGIDLLVAAARRIGAVLTVVGDGPLRSGLAAQYPEIDFLGHRSREQIANIAQTVRILVSPSRWRETFGLTALEALSSGIPVLISQFALIANEISESGFGLQCNPYDQNDLAAILTRMLQDDTMVEAMSRRAFAGASLLTMTPEQWGDELLALYADRTSPADNRTKDNFTRVEPRRLATC